VVGTTDLLLEKAEKEFLEKGFEEASLRKISADSGVSTHTIYTRFGDKAGLFDALVKDTSEDLLKKITSNEKDSQEDQRMSFLLDYIYSNYKTFKLIFCKSQGTEYEGYLDKLSALEEKIWKKNLKKMNADAGDIFFIHTTCKNTYRNLYDLVNGDLSLRKAREFMDKALQFRKAGWQAVLNEKTKA